LRATVCLLLVVGCLPLAGCKHSGNKDGLLPSSRLNTSGGGGTGPRADAAHTDPGAPPPGADGLLAGQVLDSFNRHPENVSIQIVDLQDTRPTPARIEVEPPEKGYFTIQGLQVGRHYQLIARVKDGTKVLSGTTLATPPNPRVTIYLSEDNTNDNTPPLPGPPTLPEKRKPTGGGAVIEPPRRMDPPLPGDGENPVHRGVITPPGGGIIPAPTRTKPPNATNVADQDGLRWAPPTVSVPTQPAPPPVRKVPPDDTLPPVAPKDDVVPPRDGAKPSKPKNNDSARAPQPSGSMPNNSCILVGKKLEDFSLTDLDGAAWQYKRDHKGQVVLLDFWSTGSDLAHVHQLTNLQKNYSSFGLEVVGIAYEAGPLKQQVSNVRSIRGRYTINYTTILGAPADSCQVKKQFDVNQFPTAILLDERGQIIFRADGLDKTQLQELEAEIRKRLGVSPTFPSAEE
jgi:hypothetical protein